MNKQIVSKRPVTRLFAIFSVIGRFIMGLAITLTLLNTTFMIINYKRKSYKYALISACALGLSIGMIFNAL